MLFQQIDFTKGFIKQYKKLKPIQKQRFNQRLVLFKQNPYAKELRNHALRGRYVGYRSIDVQGNLRALYYVAGDRIVVFAIIGTHSQLYG